MLIIFSIMWSLVLVVSLLLILLGYLLFYKTPTFNNWIGYRTKSSKSNLKAWNYANKITGKVLLSCGCISLLISVIIICIGMTRLNSWLYAVILPNIIMFSWVLVLIVFIIKIEKKLKNSYKT